MAFLPNSSKIFRDCIIYSNRFCVFIFFREFLAGSSTYYVPDIIPELSSKRVITTELIKGIPVDQTSTLDQDTRNKVFTSYYYFPTETKHLS